MATATPIHTKEAHAPKSPPHSNTNHVSFMLPVEEIAKIAKQNCDAWMQSMQIMATGINQITQAAMQFGQSMIQTKLDAFQAAAGARNMHDVAQVHKDYAKTSMAALFENGERIIEMVREVATNTAQPLKQRSDETIAQFRHRPAA